MTTAYGGISRFKNFDHHALSILTLNNLTRIILNELLDRNFIINKIFDINGYDALDISINGNNYTFTLFDDYITISYVVIVEQTSRFVDDYFSEVLSTKILRIELADPDMFEKCLVL